MIAPEAVELNCGGITLLAESMAQCQDPPDAASMFDRTFP